MLLYSVIRSKRVEIFMTLSVFFLLISIPARGEIGVSLPPVKTPFVPLVDRNKLYPFSLSYPLQFFPVQYPINSTHTISIDSTGNLVTVRRLILGQDIQIPYYLSFSNYLSRRLQLETQSQWKEYARTHVVSTRTQNGGRGGIVIESPKIKSKAFRRLFGGETMSLNVTGTITINGEMRHENRSQTMTATNRRPQTNFQMKQTQQFKVEGKIGNNVSVLVDQDSERPFEFNNALKLKYSSDEDGIVKSIEAGNVNLSLPATQFVTFSAKNSGLFGIKSQMKVGKLDLTAIASMEKGQKKRLSLKGGKESQTFQIHDYEYKRDTYFFLDYGYRKRYSLFDSKGNHIYNPDSIITHIEVYKSDYNYDNKVNAVRAWAVLDPTSPQIDTTEVQQENFPAWFIRLEPNKDYYVNKELGFIVMNMPLQESEILAVAYRDSAGHSVGTLLENNPETKGTPFFKLIKPRTPRPTDKTWNLEWKNVYSLGTRNISQDEFEQGFQIKIYYKPPSGDPQESLKINGKAKSFLTLFGLDNTGKHGEPNPDGEIDVDPNILSLSRGEIIFPNLRPFDPEPNTPYNFPKEMDGMRTPAIYDTTSTSYIHQQSKFYIEVKSSRRSPNYDLGMNVIEGSEKVTLNGNPLQRDKDYKIDYFSGTLTLLNEDATNPNADLEITYESQKLFSVAKTSLMGARAEYTLGEEGSNRSFIGATLLYLNKTTLDQRIRVGREAPMKNLVWDINTNLNFKPNFLTKAFNSLPLLNVSGGSSLSIIGEFAQVIPNPNTLNNKATGDPDGVAYLDDFEGSKRETSLSVIRLNWVQSSLPMINTTTKADLTRKGHLLWYNPVEQVPIREIWPKREVTTSFGGSTVTQVLTLDFTPNDTLQNLYKSWGGIERALPAGYADQTESRFLEIMVQGDHGRLHIDLGQISEDVIPNNKLNTEDKRRGGTRDRILEDDEDTGLDGMFGADPPTLFYPHEEAHVVMKDGKPYGEPYDFWDINSDGIKEKNEPWSYDNWSYTNLSRDYSHINGTENSKDDGSAIYPNTEDINGNGDVDLNNNYFEFTFSLEKDNPDTIYIAGNKGNRYGWRLYRIPLNKPSLVVGNPDWSRIEFARIWVDSVDQRTQLSIAEINLAGNEWKLRGVKNPGDSTYVLNEDTTMSIAVMNTHDNPDYTSPPGVEGVIDPIQRIRSKEQSLTIQLDNLEPGAAAIAQKQFYQPQNLLQYRTLKMFVHGGGIYNDIPADSSIEFFLQWGSDTKGKHYYEVSLPVFPGWDKRNNINVDFDELTHLKIEMEQSLSDTISKVLDNGHIISVVGKPSLSNIRWLIIGVKNKGKFPFSGQIWIDELRLSNVRKDKGKALRARASLKIGDNFFTINGEITKKNADFHTVNDRFGKGANTLGENLNASVQLHKFLPTEWGISLPLTATFSKNRQTPKYIPGSDILVHEKTDPDTLLDKIRSKSAQQGFSIRFAKRTKSRNFLIRYFLDPIKGNFNYSRTDASSSQIKYSKNVARSGSFSYSLSLGKQYYWHPFKWLGTKGFFKKLAAMKFYYLPSRFSLKMQGNDSNKDREERGGVKSHILTSNFNRNLSISLNPVESLSFDFTKSWSYDMRGSKWSDIFSSLNPGKPLSTTQQFSASFNPQILAWLTPTAKYTASYKWNNNPQMAKRGTGQTSSVNSNFTFSATLNPKKFVDMFHKKSYSYRRRTRRPIVRRKHKTKTTKKTTEEKTKKKKSFPLFSIFSGVGKIIQKIDPISIHISQTSAAQDRGLLGMPSFSYQIGTTLDPGVPISEAVTQPISTKKNQNLSLNSGFRFTQQLTAKFVYTLSNSENQTAQTTGNISRSVFLWKDKALPIPNWSLQWRGIEKLPIFSKVARSVFLSHSFSGKKTEIWNGSSNQTIQERLSRDFRPLLGLSLTFKNGFTANVQYVLTENLTLNKKFPQGKSKQYNSTISITAQYSKRGGIKIPFIKGKKLDNNIDFSLTFDKSHTATYQINEIDKEFTNENITTETKSWSFKPKITYTFTSTVRGGMHFEIGKREDKRIGKTAIKGFGINAIISLGR